MGRMGGAGRIVQQPRLAGCERVMHAHPCNRFVCEIAIQNVAWVAEIRLNRRGVLVQCRMPLVAVAAEEPVEVFEAEAGWPQVEWTCLAGHPVRHVMHLAEPRSIVAVLPEHSPHGTGAL